MKHYLIRTAASAALILAAAGTASAQVNFDRGADYGYTGGGALIGGIIGSNVAGSGVQDEGTAIGAVIGGLAGNYIGNRIQARQSGGAYYGHQGYGAQYGGAHYGHGVSHGGSYGHTQSTRYGDAGAFGGGSYPVNTGYGYGAPVAAPSGYSHGGYVAGPIQTQSYTTVQHVPVQVHRPAPVRHVQRVTVTPRYVAPQPVQTSIQTYQAPTTTRVYTAPAPVAYTPPAPVVSQPYQMSETVSTYESVPCPSGTTTQSDGSCLQGGSIGYSSSAPTYSANTYTAPAPTYTAPAPTYVEPAPTYTAPTYSAPVQTADCPAGTTAQSDGTCLQSGSVSYGGSSTYSSGTTYDSGVTYGSTSTYGSTTHSTGMNCRCD